MSLIVSVVCHLTVKEACVVMLPPYRCVSVTHARPAFVHNVRVWASFTVSMKSPTQTSSYATDLCSPPADASGSVTVSREHRQETKSYYLGFIYLYLNKSLDITNCLQDKSLMVFSGYSGFLHWVCVCVRACVWQRETWHDIFNDSWSLWHGGHEPKYTVIRHILFSKGHD